MCQRPKREQVVGGWRRLHNELHKLYASPNNIRKVKSRRLRWVQHVACIGEIWKAYKIWAENLKGRDCSQDPGIDFKVLLEWILEK